MGKITNIIPLRLIEFCVTPYDCIDESTDGKFYIYLRRSSLKGQKKGSKHVSHKIDDDYSIYMYVVSEEIADLIKEYKEITSKNRKDYTRLMCHVTYMLRTHPNGDKLSSDSEVFCGNFGRGTLKNLKNRFFTEIVQDEYNYEILNCNEFIAGKLNDW